MVRTMNVEKVAAQCDLRRQSHLFRDLSPERLHHSGMVQTHSRSAPMTLITTKLFGNKDPLPIYVHRYS